MTWYEKLERLKSLLPAIPELAIVLDLAKSGMPEDEINWIKRRFPFVSDEYVEFLGYSDGIQLDMFVLFGSEHSHFPALKRALVVWGDGVDFTKYLPIGEDASGDAFLLYRDGKIYIANIKEPTRISYLTDSFESLINEYFLGKNYPLFFPNELHNPQWLNFLREQGWIERI